ncbi:baseplate J/gp47 family protein [Anaerotruncus colihominis]|uniref:Baseplate protein J-like barrel domain-containing protein n=1 Tax=Anaerotruncus colihominis TaxID=169435 RepID=A0A845SWX3_9FIRM|nr:baseplate J/gp47 family protein [Anaerotruncus colihominis]MCR2026093.1 baseplate J/gp47 family protein [Anaerotruncus colihominis]NDO38427.1 hypothetical protein [Anaerotruncus colihominis]
MKQYDEQALYTRMTARYQELAGFLPDEASDIALRFHALAGELAQVCAALDEASRQAAPQTATGERLELYAGLRGLERIAAAHASGTLVFKRYKTGGEEIVPAGTLCLAADETAYLTLKDAAFGDGQEEASAPARACEPGRAGNAAAGRILKIDPSLPNISVKNPEAFTGGRDIEDDASLRRRLIEAVKEPSNGVNAAFYRDFACNFPGISDVAVQAGAQMGDVDLLVTAPDMERVPPDVKTALEAALDERRALCASVAVRDAQTIPVDVHITVRPARDVPFETARASIEARVRALLGQKLLGEGLTRARLYQLVMDGGQAENCNVLAPLNDQTAGPVQALRAGVITVEEMGAANGA